MFVAEDPKIFHKNSLESWQIGSNSSPNGCVTKLVATITHVRFQSSVNLWTIIQFLGHVIGLAHP